MSNMHEYESQGQRTRLNRAAAKGAKRAMRVVMATALVAIGAASSRAGEVDSIAPLPRIQLALLLDTSNSMDGLIRQAQAQLWRVVNEFAKARKGEANPTLEVALYEYGNNGLAAESQWVRQVVPFTTDLDLLSEMLFALRTNGGSEYCGAVMAHALGGLKWSDDPGDLRTVFIAGNEPFNQGQTEYRTVAGRAREKGIHVNTIFCGNRQEGISTFWQDGATLGGGSFSHIDQEQAIREMPAPQDKEIEQLGVKLNATYIPYGAGGAAGTSNQYRQDGNAAGLNRSSNVERQLFKGSKLYSNDGWDLVDGVKKGKVDLESLDREALPEAMRDLSATERAAFVETKREERQAIQDRLQALRVEREAFLESAKKDGEGNAPESLDAAMMVALRTQAEAKGFRFE